MVTVTSHVSSSYLSLDSWSETYVAARWLAQDELPEQQWQAQPRHGPLSQLVLIAAHRLVEVQLFGAVRKLLDAAPGKHPEIEERFPRGFFDDAFKRWPAQLTGRPFDTTIEPFRSAAALQQRRNATVHKEAALCSLPMARAALYSGVEASRAIAVHLLGPGRFAYEPVLAKYPLPASPWFADVPLVNRPR